MCSECAPAGSEEERGVWKRLRTPKDLPSAGATSRSRATSSTTTPSSRQHSASADAGM